jgi:RecA/RadA recombinase
MKRGLIIEINGPRRGGKTYIAEKICVYLSDMGYDVEIVNGYSSKEVIDRSISEHDITIIDN